MEKRNKKLFTGIALAGLVLAVLILSSASVSAELWACFTKNEVVNFCNPAIQDRTCNSDLCKYCMASYNATGECFSPGNFNACNNLANQNCAAGVGNATIDSEPPVINISSPLEGGLFTSSSVLLSINVDELSELGYKNLKDPRRTIRICNDCSSDSHSRRFDEGLNKLTIIATDRAGNEAQKNVSFFVDSKNPRIGNAEPRRGFANGDFMVEIDEANPKDLFLNYGNPTTGFRNKKLNVSNDCVPGRRGFDCSTHVDLTDYDLEELQYFFNLTDIVGNFAESRPSDLDVDVSPPVINLLNYTIDGGKVFFSINITEQNLDEVDYLDLSDPRPRERRLCSRLKEGICDGRATFKDGEHELSISVIDEAGNSVGKSISFFTDSKKPKIRKTNPSRGFANGDFDVEFAEENPTSLFLNYGNIITGFRNKELNINDSCVLGSRSYICNTNVPLSDYDSQEIEYWFNITDRVNQTDESRHTKLNVDTTFPVINSLNWSIDNRNNVRFLINVTELNFDEVTYLDAFDPSGREKRLCSRLRDGICDTTHGFSPGNHSLSISVVDDAGNLVGQSIQFEAI